MGVQRPNISGNAATATKLKTPRKIGGVDFDGSGDVTPHVAERLYSSSNGVAPHYAVRAWCVFNQSGTLAVLDSENVTSVTDNGAGNSTVNMTQGILDNQFATAMNTSGASTVYEVPGVRTATSIGLQVVNTGWSAVDSAVVSVWIIQ